MQTGWPEASIEIVNLISNSAALVLLAYLAARSDRR